MLSVQIPVVEELLAQSYRQKAEMWAEAAGVLRTQRREQDELETRSRRA